MLIWHHQTATCDRETTSKYIAEIVEEAVANLQAACIVSLIITPQEKPALYPSQPACTHVLGS
jgi:hypothetical protein